MKSVSFKDYFNTENQTEQYVKLQNVFKLHSLGWKHSVNIDKGIKIMYDWYLKK